MVEHDLEHDLEHDPPTGDVMFCREEPTIFSSSLEPNVLSFLQV